MENWHKVEKQEDISLLFSAYGGFHDSCIAAVHFQSGAFVDESRTMHFGGPDDCKLSVIFHRQWEPKILELQFIGVRQMHLAAWQACYTSDIFDAYLAFHSHLLPGEPARVLVWADSSGFDVKKAGNGIREPSDTYIVANALMWRIVE